MAERKKNIRVDRVLNALTTRLGTAVSVCAILVLGVGGSFFVRDAVSNVQETGTARYNENLREAIFALGDVHRLSYALQRAAADSPLTPETIIDFASALESLYLHKATIGQHLRSGDWNSEAVMASGALSAIIEAGEGITLSEVQIPEAELTDFLDRAEGARETIVAYIDTIRQDHDLVLTHQRNTLDWLVRALEITLIVMGIIGVSAFLMLHREVSSRRKREAAERKADYLAYNDPLTWLVKSAKIQRPPCRSDGTEIHNGDVFP